MAGAELTAAQRSFLDRLCESKLTDTFYLSGGTALSAFHAHHRLSEDLDFFSRDPFDAGPVLRLIHAVADAPPAVRRIHLRLGFLLKLEREPLKVEFVHYDHDCIEPPRPRYGCLRVDGLRDILANKLSTIVERTEPKDYADLAVMLSRLGQSLDQGIEDCRRKFGWPGLEYLLQAALLRAETLTGWPTIEPPMLLTEAQSLFRHLARSLIRLDEDEG